MREQVIADKLIPAEKNQIFEMEGWYVWGASVCREGENYYIFAAAWKKEFGFSGWVTHSTIVQGIGKKPEGPFSYVREMTELKMQDWSCEVLHNPTVLKIGETYYLYYIGTNGAPSIWNHGQSKKEERYRWNQKIGVAYGTTLKKPLTPSGQNPILQPKEGGWDDTYVTNPAITVGEKGIYLVYKSLIKRKLPDIVMKLGIAVGENPEGPFVRIGNTPILDENIEDPFLWKEKGIYNMIVKDMTGHLAGKTGEAVLYQSEDGIHWNHPPIRAYGMEIMWKDGRICYSNVERPQIYLENGKKICLYNAAGMIPGVAFNVARRFRNEK